MRTIGKTVYDIPHSELALLDDHKDPLGKIFVVIQKVILPSFHNQGYWSDLAESRSSLREGDIVFCNGFHKEKAKYGDAVWLQEEPKCVIDLRHLRPATIQEQEQYRLQFIHCNYD